MSATLYELIRVAFPELKELPLPDEPELFSNFEAWINQLYPNLMRLDGLDVQQNGIAECHRLQQLQIDLDELKSHIQDEMSTFHNMYESSDLEEEYEEDQLHAYDFEFTYKVILSNIQMFVEPYDLAVLAIEQDQPYWMLVPENDELIQNIIHHFGLVFSASEPMLRID
ncbi:MULTISPECIES: hypothetical protein [Acinetobacter]|uniref:hypothetical protein n=1 Tax=Acinetobacter TaxID=469 RepID=UPI000EA3ADFD|nr:MULTISPECIES: hypothetical protein [Acinetobacter]RKG45846.1 hypothetical protein D7V51_04160 [Acinetobacter cumulans]RZG60933.1 hypothetical protein EXE29_03705 [Acinetobacter sp. WCHAc060006]